MHAVRLTMVLLIALLTACGGGGGSSPTPNAVVTAAPTPIPFANTANPTYMPLANGNHWTFSSGGAMSDVGPITLACACTINGLVVEAVDLSTPTGAYSSTFYFKKNTPAGYGLQTLLLGTSTNHGALISFITNGTIYGLAIMDDNATLGETQTFAGVETSTISAINQTQLYVNGQSFDFVNTDLLTGSLVLSWNFAKGVGITSITLNGQTITLASFSINVAGSQSIERATQSIHTQAVPLDGSAANPAAGLFQ